MHIVQREFSFISSAVMYEFEFLLIKYFFKIPVVNISQFTYLKQEPKLMQSETLYGGAQIVQSSSPMGGKRFCLTVAGISNMGL